jgi:Protein of unknown function (DUF1569)
MPVNTAKVEGRRQIDYKSMAELLAAAERMSSGNVKTLGNWSAGQIFRHLANSFNGSIDGLQATFPWYIRWMGRIFKKKLLSGRMRSGMKMPDDLAKTVMPEVPTEQGLANLRAAITRLESDPHRAKHPVFGNITRDEWNQVHLHHASLHMSFLVP